MSICTGTANFRGPDESVAGLGSFIQNYLNPCFAAGIITQFMDGFQETL